MQLLLVEIILVNQLLIYQFQFNEINYEFIPKSRLNLMSSQEFLINTHIPKSHVKIKLTRNMICRNKLQLHNKFFLIIALILLNYSSLLGQSNIEGNEKINNFYESAFDVKTAVLMGNVSGRVTDSESGEALIGATVNLKNTTIGTATNIDGEYMLGQLQAGEQVLVVRSLGYRPKEITVEVVDGETVVHDVSLELEQIQGEEIVIGAQALGQAKAVNEQVSSNTIVNVVSEDRLRELPDANAAETIGRLPGISVLRDAGEGQKISIRGMGPQYSSITIDGNQVPGTSGDRSVDLSMISQDMLAGIEVYKAIRPDMDADAVGGSVNFRMGGAPDETRYRVTFESGYSGQIGGIGNYKGSVLGSSRFLNDRLGVMFSANAQQIDRSAHISSSTYRILRDAREGEPHAPVEVNSLNLQDVDGTRKRYGAGLTLDWRLPNGNIITNNSYSRQDREDFIQDRRYNLTSNRQEWVPTHTKRNLYTLNNTISGEHDFSWVKLDWGVNRSESINNTPYSNSGTFYEPGALDRAGVDLTGGPEVLPDIALNRTELAFLDGLDFSERKEYQRNYTASVDIEVPVAFGRHVDGYVKFGGKHYNKYRDRLSTDYYIPNFFTPVLWNNPDSDFPWVVNSSGRASMEPFITNPDQRYNIIDGNYEMAHLPSIELIDLMWEDYSELYKIDYSPRFDDYYATERMSAGYIMTELNIGSKLMILPGVRYEYEHSDYNANVGRFTKTISDFPPEIYLSLIRDSVATRDMGMWFPMVQARYQLTDWFDIRASRTVAASRPSFGSMSPTLEINYDGGSVTRGNTQIKPMRATNYDLFFTFNHNKIGLFTLGGFYKEVEDLIYNRSANIIDPAALGLEAKTRLFTISEPVNNENLTTVHGFELEWQSNLIGLPYPFNGLVINANYSRFFSEAHYHSFEIIRTAQGFVGVDNFRTAPMVHQADHIANVSVGYDYRNFSTRFSMQYQGATLRSIGDRAETDGYTNEYLRFDGSIRQRFLDDRLHLIANLNNITNREDRSSQFTEDRPRIIEYYGASFNVGIEYRF